VRAPAILLRVAGFLALWLVLAGAKLQDFPAALVAVVAATYVSLRLSPPSPDGVSLPGLAALLVRFPVQSLTAGIDVARRVFSPDMPLRVGTVVYSPRLPPGPSRDAFTAYASLMPGTLPLPAEDGNAVLIHCLDVDQPAMVQMAADEARFIRMLGRSDG
jgi:multicomponent Na+:H+ antiporter subunit E